mgnify:CR=1 FL=1
MSVGVVQFDQETNEVEWFNPYAELIFTSEEGEFEDDVIRRIIGAKREGDATQTFELNGNKYSSYIDLQQGFSISLIHLWEIVSWGMQPFCVQLLGLFPSTTMMM